MHRHISLLDKLIVFIFSYLLIIDTFTGYFLQSGVILPITLSQLVKMFIILLMLWRIFVLNTRYFIHLVFLFLSLFVSIFLNYAMLGIFEWNFEISILLKTIVIPICMYYFVLLLELDFNYFLQKITQIFSIAFFIILINIALGVGGFGFNSYSSGIGVKGFFYAGNELSILYVVLFTYLLFYIFNQYSKLIYIGFSICGFIFGLFIATKVSILSIFIMIFLVPILQSKWRLNIKKFVLFTSASMLFVGLIFFIINYLSFNGLLNKWTYFLKIYDYNYLSIILSGRDLFLKQAMTMAQDYPSWYHQLFGYSYGGYINLLEQSSSLKSQSIEMDFFDMYFYYGIIGLCTVLSFWVKAWYHYYNIKSSNKILIISSLLILFISFLSGHVLYSGMSGPFIGIFLALLFQKDLFPNKAKQV